MNIEFTSVKEVLTAIKSNLVAEKAKFNELQKAIDNDLMDCERALKALEKQEPELSKAHGRLPKKGDKLISIADKHFGKDEEVEVIHVDDDYFDVISENSTICKCIYISSLHDIFRFKDEEPTPVKKTDRLPKKGDKIFANNNDEYTTTGFPYTVMRHTSSGFYIVNDRSKDCYFTYIHWQDFFHFQDEAPTPEDLANLHSFQHVNPEPKEKPYRIKTWEEMLDTKGVVSLDNGVLEYGECYFRLEMNNLCGKELYTNNKQFVSDVSNNNFNEWTIAPWMITENN